MNNYQFYVFERSLFCSQSLILLGQKYGKDCEKLLQF